MQAFVSEQAMAKSKGCYMYSSYVYHLAKQNKKKTKPLFTGPRQGSADLTSWYLAVPLQHWQELSKHVTRVDVLSHCKSWVNQHCMWNSVS